MDWFSLIYQPNGHFTLGLHFSGVYIVACKVSNSCVTITFLLLASYAVEPHTESYRDVPYDTTWPHVRWDNAEKSTFSATLQFLYDALPNTE